MTGIPSLFLYGLVRLIPVPSLLERFDVPPEHRRSSGHGLGFSRSCPYVRECISFPLELSSLDSFYDNCWFSYGRSGARYVTGSSARINIYPEVCSAHPTSGGPYFWAAMLPTPKRAPFASWICGWFNLLGQVAVTTGIRLQVPQKT